MEYTTTSTELFEPDDDGDISPETVVEPDGKGWILVSSCMSETHIVWTWRRRLSEQDDETD